MIIFTWPLLLDITSQSLASPPYLKSYATSVDIDRDQFIWDLWWVKKALVDFRVNPYHTGYLYYPYGVDLYLQSLTPVNGVLATFFQGWLGWLGAFNVVCLIIFVWCGHSAYLLADYLFQNKVAAFVAGLFYTLAPQHYFNLHLAQLNVITIQFLPLYLLFFFKLAIRGQGSGVRGQKKAGDLSSDHELSMPQSSVLSPQSSKTQHFYKTRRWWLYTGLAAFFLVLNTISDQYLLLYGLIISGLFYLWRGGPMLLRRQWADFWGMLARTIPALLLTGLVLSPFLYATWRTINSGQWTKITNAAVPTDLTTLFLPPVNNIFVGAHNSEWGKNFFIEPIAHSYSIGLVGLAMAIYAAIRFPAVRWWGFLLLVCLIMATGAELSFNNQGTGFLMPGYWLNQLPVFGVMRYSRRWIGPASLAIGLAVAGGLTYHLKNISRRNSRPGAIRLKQGLLVGLVVGLFMLEVEPWPVTMSGSDGQMLKVYSQKVLPDNDRRAILEIPHFPKNNARSNEMYWQTTHERPIMGGYISRPYNLSYLDTPFAFFIEGYRPFQPDFLKLEPTDLKNVLDYYNFGFVALYKIKMERAEVESWRSLVEKMLGPNTKPLYEDDQTIMYHLPEQAGQLQPLMVRGQGWSSVEQAQDGNYSRWIMEGQVNLPLFLPPDRMDGPHYLEFRARGYRRERTVEVRVNGQKATQFKVTTNFQSFRLELERQWFKPGDNLITMDALEPPDRPSVVENSQDTRPLSVLINSLRYTDKA